MWSYRFIAPHTGRAYIIYMIYTWLQAAYAVRRNFTTKKYVESHMNNEDLEFTLFLNSSLIEIHSKKLHNFLRLP